MAAGAGIEVGADGAGGADIAARERLYVITGKSDTHNLFLLSLSLSLNSNTGGKSKSTHIHHKYHKKSDWGC